MTITVSPAEFNIAVGKVKEVYNQRLLHILQNLNRAQDYRRDPLSDGISRDGLDKLRAEAEEKFPMPQPSELFDAIATA